MDGKVSGVNEAGIDKLALEIIDYADKLNKVFNQLQILVDNTNSYFNSESGDVFRKNMKIHSENYKVLNQNILNYASDFVKVKEFYKKETIKIADILQSSVNK